MISQTINQSILRNVASQAIDPTINQKSVDPSTSHVLDPSMAIADLVKPGDAPVVKPDQSAIQPTNQAVDVLDDGLLIPIAELMNREPFKSSLGGLSTSQVEIRLARDGLNEFAAAGLCRDLSNVEVLNQHLGAQMRYKNK